MGGRSGPGIAAKVAATMIGQRWLILRTDVTGSPVGAMWKSGVAARSAWVDVSDVMMRSGNLDKASATVLSSPLM